MENTTTTASKGFTLVNKIPMDFQDFHRNNSTIIPLEKAVTLGNSFKDQENKKDEKGRTEVVRIFQNVGNQLFSLVCSLYF